MNTLYFIFGGKVEGKRLSDRFKTRLDRAIELYINEGNKNNAFFVSGRTGNIMHPYEITEAERAKQYILEKVPDTTVYKEEIATEMIGNIAFSKPLIKKLEPGKVIAIAQKVSEIRIKTIERLVNGNDIAWEFDFVKTELYGQEFMIEKEKKALQLFETVFEYVTSGDDTTIRDMLLYETPYYYKGLVNDAQYFDEFWPGGFKDFIGSMDKRNSKG